MLDSGCEILLVDPHVETSHCEQQRRRLIGPWHLSQREPNIRLPYLGDAHVASWTQNLDSPFIILSRRVLDG
jgi:hypothetical protein